MKTTLLRFADGLRASYWFLPTVMALGAVLLAGGMILLDTYAGSDWMDGLPWLYAARPDGARQVLSTVSASMITVAGTVFSVTIAAVVYASGQYGPRLLSNFMSDRGNQVTLGTFIATFVYCLLVLRTIRSADEAGAGAGFVPNLALLVGVALALCSIAVLIFFIHHVPSQLHINSVIEDVGEKLLKEIGARFPQFIGAPRPDDAGQDDASRVPATFKLDASEADGARRASVDAKRTGYLQIIDEQAIMAIARDQDLVLRLQYQPGDFVHVGRTLVEASPPERCDEETATLVAGAFAVGSRRTALQDLRFLVDELVEIAARALSPGVNDPFTAVTCLDWLGAALSDLAGRELPSHLRVDEDGALRVITHPVTFAGFMDRGFGALAQYCATDMVASLRFIRALGEVSLGCDDPARLRILDDHAVKLAVLARHGLHGCNQERVITRTDELRRALAEPDYKRRLRDSSAWLGGAA
ncbi:MAG: DUF2254 domain-containing protein [Alphaproteobacteria bacterium]|nr:DUF2254 domain-containing protein [Alphaproteobacteria bacterium]MBU1516623.1 DUF2254 domain-containing protein [Alphaproteobacteria bacterium]MBU2094379.1 DUF2254 domain-containing protein [Alphaproteobacteria bacterium]MBU2153264.1 DUF2254 domain-containing protein [Alphaproteobacteria bacterium]MBU2307550.1 DUF2254 domain-containing protein [Alphaproteobacteria bacterium]